MLEALIRRVKILIKSKIFLFASAIILFLFLINISFYISSHFPSSCKACHYMKPYYEQWKNSKHNRFSCIKCHPFRLSFIYITSLKYFTGLYNPRPHARMKDSSCLKKGCHSKEEFLEKPVLFEGKIYFPHDKHYEKFKRVEVLRCVNCHSQIVQGSHITVPKEVCFLCHFKNIPEAQALGGCESCHGAPKETVMHGGLIFDHQSYLKIGVQCDQCHVKVKEGDGGVPAEKCHNCHVERKETSVVELHRIHATENNIYCFFCHSSIEHRGVEFAGPLETLCSRCHEEKHIFQKQLYMGVGGIGVRNIPSRMFAAQVSCEGCHKGKTTEGIKKECVNCHGEKYDIMLDVWMKEIKGATEYVESEVNRFMGKLKGLKGAREDVRTLISDARKNLNLVREGRGVHNPEYAVRALQSSIEALKIVSKFIPDSLSLTNPPPVLRGEDGYCMKLCHSVIGIPEEVFFDEMKIKFPHNKHIKEISITCAKCHSPENHKMMIITKEECMKCHHEKEKKLECSSCHRFQWNLYNGNYSIPGLKPVKGEMARGDVSCTDCHRLDIAQVDMVEIKSKCVECHDESYGKLFLDWEEESTKITGEILFRLDSLKEKFSLYSRAKPAKVQNLQDNLKKITEISNYILLGKPVHNMEGGREISKYLNEKIKEIETKLGE